MDYQTLAAEYRQSAARIAPRIARLQGEAGVPEERLLPLQMEYYQLLQTASCLEEYGREPAEVRAS